MIRLEDIKPFPCLPGATVVAVESSEENPESNSGPIFEQPTLTLIAATAGWTDLGNGSFEGNLAGTYNFFRLLISGLVDGGVYAVSAQITAYTSGGLQGPGLSVNGGDPGAYHLVQGADGLNMVRGGFFVWRTGMPTEIAIRANANFVGTVSNISVIRIG